MSESPNICQSCSHENKLGAKFCVNCGTTIVAIPHEKLDNFKSYLEDMILDGDDPRDDEANLLKEAVEDIGIPLSLAKKVFQEVCSSNSQSNVGVRISYDTQLAKKGVAQGNSILVIKVDNLTNKSIGSVSIAVTHPEEGTRIDLGKIRSLGPQKSKPIETTLRFNLVGPQLIREGQIKVESLSGLTDVYLLASPIRMSTENSNASRSTTTTVNTSIVNHSIADNTGVSGIRNSETQIDSAVQTWEVVRLKRSNFNDKNNNAQVMQHNPEAAPIETGLIVESVEAASETDEIKSQKLIFDLGPEISSEIDEIVSRGDAQGAKLAALNEFVRLLSFYPKAQSVPKGGVYLSSDIDLVLLTTIATAAKIKRSDISAILVNKVSSTGDELESFQGEATVFSGQGLITLTAKNGSIELVDKYGWSFLKESSWGVFRQGITPGGYIFSLGDESTDYCLPNLTFDLRKNNAKVDLEDLYSRLDFLFDKIKTFSGGKENRAGAQKKESISDEESHTTTLAEDDNPNLTYCECVQCDWRGPIDDTFMDEETNEMQCPECGEPVEIEDNEVDENQDEYEEVEDDEIEFAVRQFFVMFAFVSQFCDRENDRPVHVFVEQENGGDVDVNLARSIQALFPKSKLIAICEEDLESVHDAQSRIISWRGIASVVTRDGIFNVNSDGLGNYDIASKQAFLSWSKFFEDLKGQLIVRYSVPDIWLGTQDNYLIKGCYIDYSNNIESFIYFEEFFHNDLNERFAELQEIIENA